MKYIITRTSVWNDEDIKVEEAIKETLDLTSYDTRTVNSIEEAKKLHWYQDWASRGTNHREENGYIICDYITTETIYTIEINSLEELMNLQDKYGELIITKSNYKEFECEIEIYDDYRE